MLATVFQIGFSFWAGYGRAVGYGHGLCLTILVDYVAAVC